MDYVATMDFNHPDSAHLKHKKGNIYDYKEDDAMTKTLVFCGYLKPANIKISSAEIVKEEKVIKKTKELKVSKKTK